MGSIPLQQFGKPNDDNFISRSAVGSLSEQSNLLECKKFCKTRVAHAPYKHTDPHCIQKVLFL